MNILSLKDLDNCMYSETSDFFKELVDVWLTQLIEHGNYDCPVLAEQDLWRVFKGGNFCFIPTVENVAAYHKSVHQEFIKRGMFERFIKPCSKSIELSIRYAVENKVVVMTHSDTEYALYALDYLGYLGKTVEEKDVWGFDRLGVCLSNMKTQEKPFIHLLNHYGYEAKHARITEDSEFNLVAPHKLGLTCNHITQGSKPIVNMNFNRFESYADYLQAHV